MSNPIILNLWPDGSTHNTLVTGQWLPRIESTEYEGGRHDARLAKIAHLEHKDS